MIYLLLLSSSLPSFPYEEQEKLDENTTFRMFSSVHEGTWVSYIEGFKIKDPNILLKLVPDLLESRLGDTWGEGCFGGVFSDTLGSEPITKLRRMIKERELSVGKEIEREGRMVVLDELNYRNPDNLVEKNYGRRIK